MNRQNPILTLEDIHYTVAGHEAELFSGLQFTAKPGERIAIVGGEGAGKSTLMRIMAGLISPSAGRVLFAGEPITAPPPPPGGIGLLFRDSANHFLTPMAQEEILLGLMGVDDLEAAGRVTNFLELAALPPQAATWYLANLSASQQSRVAIAALLASKPRLILADEPGLNLDLAGEQELGVQFKELTKDEQAVQVVFTSRLERASVFADRTLYLSEGILSDTPSTSGQY
ncbi:MAG: ABC transporter ATP-binding protein [Magnetococcales bacterium]|nr:ABC transporter ATP-binding protein [Magnetococcales bacterium]